jgi:hypothetical protein
MMMMMMMTTRDLELPNNKLLPAIMQPVKPLNPSPLYITSSFFYRFPTKEFTVYDLWFIAIGLEFLAL